MSRAVVPSFAATLLAIVGAATAQTRSPPRMSAPPSYAAHCQGCHGPDLGGAVGPSTGPALRGADFVAKWKAAGPGALLAYIKATMPANQPGGLDAATYAEVADFIAAKNGLPRESTAPVPGAAKTSAAAKPEGAAASIEKMAAALGSAEVRDDAVAAAARRRLAALGAAVTPVTDALLADPPPADWPAWRRSQATLGFSPLAQIDRGNVGRLGLAWSLSLGSGTNAIAPLVHDGVMFLDSNSTVQALDAKSGDVIWSFARPATTSRVPMNQPRSMALYGGALYVPTLDNHVIALDVHDGRVIWDHQIGKDGDQIELTAAPLAVRGKIIQGVAGCQGPDYPGGCFIVALDARTGKEAWRFNTLARPGAPGGDTWNGWPLERRFGGSVWNTGSYDPGTGLVYFGTGQTYVPSTLMHRKPGTSGTNDGLYTDSTVALDPDTGRLAWFYQHEPNDVWDLDWAFERTLVTLPTPAGPRRVVVTAGKVAILDVLDARTGQYLWSLDLGLQNLIKAIDPKTGRKIYDPALQPEVDKPKLICPSTLGFKNWPTDAYDPASGLLTMPIGMTCMELSLAKSNAGAMSPSAFGEFVQKRADIPGSEGNYGRVAAIDLKARKVAWTDRFRASQSSAVLATAGGLAFEGGRDRWFRALDSATGEELWRARLDASPSAFPISYAVGGRQYVAVVSGGGTPLDLFSASYTPEIPAPTGNKTLWVFALPEGAH